VICEEGRYWKFFKDRTPKGIPKIIKSRTEYASFKKKKVKMIKMKVEMYKIKKGRFRNLAKKIPPPKNKVKRGRKVKFLNLFCNKIVLYPFIFRITYSFYIF